MESSIEEQELFSNVAIKQEIFDPEEDETEPATGNEEKPSVKEEALDTSAVKKEVEDEEIWTFGGCAQGEEPIFDEYFLEATELRMEIKKELVTDLPFALPDFTVPVEMHDLVSEEGEEDEGEKGDSEEDGDDDKKRCPVEGCTKKLNSLEKLVKHMKKHHSAPWFCGICKRSFPKGHKLRIHYRKHTGEKPYKCDNCKKSFTQEGSLHRHQRIHTGERQYACDKCEYKSFEHAHLERHRRGHTREKPFSCTSCAYTTARSDHLTRHKKNLSH